jgi:hypothetical protein
LVWNLGRHRDGQGARAGYGLAAPERMVLRGTILVPHRGALMLARVA